MQTALTWIFAGLLALPVLFFAVAGIQLWTRRPPLRSVRSLGGPGNGRVPRAGTEEFLSAVRPHLDVRFDPGHRLEVSFCGDDLYSRLLDDLAAAEQLITWHVFWFKPGTLADRVKEVLVERARSGVRVLFLHDWWGSLGVSDEYFQELRDAGVRVHAFRRPEMKKLYIGQQRSHVRTVVIDGEVGYTGGFAISDEWLGDGRTPGQWRDTSVRIEGPTVHELQVVFASDWVEATGELLTGPSVFPESGNGRTEERENGPPDRQVFHDCLAAVFHSSPSLGGTSVERLFALSIAGARERLWITTGYFVPSPSFRDLLIEAVGRGVDVRVLHPGRNTDRAATWYAARRHYDQLLEGGVRVWEYDPTMVHSKTLVADESWCAVGTTNFDNRSMALNDEVSLLVRDERVAGLLAERFEDDLRLSTEVDLEEHRRRGAAGRVKEWVSGLAEPVL